MNLHHFGDDATTLPAQVPVNDLQGRQDTSRHCSAMLRTAALFSYSFSVNDLAAATGQPVIELAMPLQEALDQNILVEHLERLAFRHRQTKEAIYREIATPPQAHLSAAMALSRHGAALERVGEQLLRARQAWQDTATQWVVRNAEALASREPDMAVSLIRHVLHTPTALPLSDNQTDQLRVLMTASQFSAGAIDHVLDQAPKLLCRLKDPHLRRQLLSLLVKADLSTGRPDQALARVQSIMEESAIPEADCYLQGLQIASLTCLGETDQAADAAATVLTQRGAGPEAQMHAHTALSVARYVQGQAEGALYAANEGIMRITGPTTDPGDLCRLHLIRSSCLTTLDKTSDARRALATAQHLAQNAETHLTACHAARARFLYLAGEWDTAMTEIEEGLQVQDNLGMHPILHSLAALILTHRGKLPQAEGRLDLAAVPPGTASVATYLEDIPPWAHSTVDQARHRFAQAFARMADGWRNGFGPYVGQGLVHQAVDLVRAAVHLNERALAEQVTSRLERIDPLAYPLFYSATAAHCRGLLNADPHILQSAAAYYRVAPRPLARARCYEDTAVVLTEAGRFTEARAQIAQALELYTDLNAAGCTAQARRRLNDVGLTRLTSQRRSKRGWDSLTPAECKVADKIGQGLSNPAIANALFVTRGTVHIHVSNILKKLELTSRVELAAALARREHRRDTSLGAKSASS
ncbi:LuxR C-terminal-related transcriptional regulator [Streptomyces sp. NPDC086835]|uniref:LuxR C-terminal-related transcriptional regulator n=1 Tax=Streptomyces sp. NPDC086835 TaxID=3365761 RepID=UPI003821526F